MNTPIASDSNSQQRCVIVGASHAGSQLATQLRKSGWQGGVVLIGEENQLPYHRPPLSKQVMAGKRQADEILLRPAALYEKEGIRLELNTRVQQIDKDRRQITLDSRKVLEYDKLALCTGSKVLHLPFGDGLEGLCYLRTLEDVLDIRQRLSRAHNVVIIGGGYIGLEAAAVLRELGAEVTVLERADRLLSRVASQALSQYFWDLHESHGVKLVCGAEVTALNGEHRVESVSCSDGQCYPADLVIVGIGVRPDTVLAEQAGLHVDNGIVVNEQCRTSDAHIYAAGDCTYHPSERYGHVRLESVQNANDQARVAAMNICGKSEVYQTLPWFWSDQYGIKLQTAGLVIDFDDCELAGSLNVASNEGFVLRYYRQGKLLAADCINRPRDFMAIKNQLTSA